MAESLRIIIPMAGLGSRLRPLTWSRPKPLISLVGATVLDHMLRMFDTVPNREDAAFVFILSPNQEALIKAHMNKNYPGQKVHYVFQPEMKGQSDALWNAKDFLHGPILMVFSDTLIENSFACLEDEKADAVAWVKAVPDPRRFGVAEVDSKGSVNRLIEKPSDLNNNLAVVGAYYFKDAEKLGQAIEEQIERKIQLKGEYFLADAINLYLEKGAMMRTESVKVWLDAGTSDALLDTNRYMLEHGRANSTEAGIAGDTVIVPPVFIHPEARVNASVIGPYASIGAGVVVQGSIIKDSILSPGAHVSDAHLEGSLLGHDVVINGVSGKFNIGDNSWVNS
ncbi:MAG: sugar phosphate nucleotidyltransferase [Anaerolineaceae bacterium]|nr:sugar phosphate nucleotidyltransferase [Anaerolineaceae bacterium]